MKKYNLSNTIRAAFARRNRTYYAIMYIAGQRITLQIEAPNYTIAKRESEAIVDDCGVLYTLFEG